MAVTLTSTGITFSDGTSQSQRKGLVVGPAFTTTGQQYVTFTNIPTNAQKITVNVDVGNSSSGPPYVTMIVRSVGNTSTFSNDVNNLVYAVSGTTTGTRNFGSILGTTTNYISFSTSTKIIIELISRNPASMPYYHMEVYSLYNYGLLGSGTIYNTTVGGIDTVILGYNGSYTWTNPKIGITWE